jgi:hypothetical protein
MPRFVDSSYVINHVTQLTSDVNAYHTQNLKNIYATIKNIFVEKELENYENVKNLVNLLQKELDNYPSNIITIFQLFKINNDDVADIKISELRSKLEEIWNKYQEYVNSKQFFIKEQPEELVSVESLFDKVSSKATEDKEKLHAFVNQHFSIIQVDNSLIKPIWDKLNSSSYTETEITPHFQEYHKFVDDMSYKYEKLYTNFVGIFFKVISRTLDMDTLKKMVSMINNIETGHITQHNASVEIGKQLHSKFNTSK